MTLQIPTKYLMVGLCCVLWSGYSFGECLSDTYRDFGYPECLIFSSGMMVTFRYEPETRDTEDYSKNVYFVSWERQGKTGGPLGPFPQGSTAPSVEYGNSDFIFVHQDCGSPCWYVYILPLANDSSPQKLDYPYDIDVDRNLIVHLDFAGGKDLISLKNLKTSEIQTIDLPGKCISPFPGYCIDKVEIRENELYFEWDEDVALEKNAVSINVPIDPRLILPDRTSN